MKLGQVCAITNSKCTQLQSFILNFQETAEILLASSSAIAERPRDACSTSNRKPVN